jgi:8-oxo-dGTP pyrophosphatase MutT (NUDIX family)
MKELLVFDHRDHPNAGTQVPAGRIDPGETLEQCLLRGGSVFAAT